MAAKKKMGGKKRIVNNSVEEAGQSRQFFFGHSKTKTIIVLGAIVLLTIAVYSSSINNGFVNWDDDKNVYENFAIRDFSKESVKSWFTKPLIGMYTPLVYASYAIDFKLGGLDPRIYHLTNLILHLLNIILVFYLVKLLTKTTGIAAIAALLFSIHPLNVGAVAPVSVRSGLLYSFFYLAAFYCYLRYVNNNFKPRYLVFAFVLFIMSLLSKSAAVVLPLLLCLTDYYYGRKFNFKVIIEKIPFFIPSVIFGMLTIIFREGAGRIWSPQILTVFDRIYLLGYSIAFYVFKLFLPVKLSAYYPYPVKVSAFLPLEVYLSPLLILAIIYCIYRFRDYRKELIFGTLFFFINIVLVLRIIPMGGEMVCERYAYLPYIGFFLIIGWTYHWVSNGTFRLKGLVRICFIALLAGGIIFFSIASYERSKIWKDSLTLNNDILEKYPIVIFAQNNRGKARMALKDYEGAMVDFNRALEIDSNFALPYYNIGDIKAIKQDFEGAIKYYSMAIELNPRFIEAYNNRGNMKSLMRDYAGAIKDYDMAAELMPDKPTIYSNRGSARQLSGDNHGACDDWRRALQLGYRESAGMLREYCK
jgi:tetratricopeptide (TPR) repeat protein